MALVLDKVIKKFGKHIAVDDLTLTIPENEIYGFLGGNGAGKTTTFRMILGLLDKSAGDILWNDSEIGYGQSHLVGYLPEERGLYPKLTVREQIVYLGKLRGMKKNPVVNELKYWLDKFKVPEYIDKRVEELSKGNQQKIQFISAVIHQPKLLILDEPFSGLDPINVEMLKDAVINLNQRGTSIVFSSHQMSHVEELCENLCILHKGKAVVQGPLKEIKQSFGKKNLIIHADIDLKYLQDVPGVIKYKHLANGCELQIEREEVSQIVFESLQGKGFIRQFNLVEPSLNDIFIEKVGDSYE